MPRKQTLLRQVLPVATEFTCHTAPAAAKSCTLASHQNATAQAWSFKATAMVVNTGTEEVKGWEMFVGYHHREIIVSATGALSSDGYFPYDASNGTTFINSPNTDLKTSIETAGDYTKISTNIEITGTLFGGRGTATPLPKTITLVNDGWQCPAATSKGE